MGFVVSVEHHSNSIRQTNFALNVATLDDGEVIILSKLAQKPSNR